MNFIFIRGLFIVGAGLLCACSSGDDKSSAQHPTSAAEHVFSGQQRALEKAKGVEQTIMDSANKQSQELDKQTGGE